MAIIANTDFIGMFTISIDRLTENQLDQYIDQVQDEMIKDLLGCELGDLFIADLLGGVPQTQRFIDIFNEFCQDDDCGQVRSYGIKDMLLGFTYFKWLAEQPYKKTATGYVIGDSENSSSVSAAQTNMYEVYNRSIKSYQSIQWYICDNDDVYPEYKGLIKQLNTWL